MKHRSFFLLVISLMTALAASNLPARAGVKDIVDASILPLMAKEHIPGMAVGIVENGKPHVFYYGVASREMKQPVGANTLFELGSVSKTFTATLASYAQIHGFLSLSDQTGKYIEPLARTAFGNVTLLELGTHTAGALPMQVPDGIGDDAALFRYLRTWDPAAPPGTSRVYSNIGIGLLGLITAKAMDDDFPELVQRRLFPALGLTHTYIEIPAERMADYAQGYTHGGKPIRMAPGELWQEAYGVRTTAPDMVRFLEDNMNLVNLAPDVQRAVMDTHTGYFKAGLMTQDLIFEQYAYPVTLQTLLSGTAEINDNVPATALTPPEPPEPDAWLNKTGSTNGFAAYIAFIPGRKLGIVLLANRSYPLLERVTAAYAILTRLDGGHGAVDR